MGLAEIAMALSGGYGRGQQGKRQRENEQAERDRLSGERERALMLDLVTRFGDEGFVLAPDSPESPGTPMEPARRAGVPHTPSSPATEAPVPVPAPGRYRVGNIQLGDLNAGVEFDPSQTRAAKEKRSQMQAFSQLPRDEYPFPIDGYDYVTELEEFKDRQRIEAEKARLRPIVARLLGVDPDSPDVDAQIELNVDPQLYRDRRKPESEQQSIRDRAFLEDRDRALAIEEAQGHANNLARSGNSDLVILQALRRMGFDDRLPPGILAGIIDRAARAAEAANYR